MAGIRSDAIAHASGSTRVVRTMPNTPALIGQGITGVYATAHVTLPDRAWVEAVLRPTGELCWVQREADLDAVTALSGSGPAYVFYFVEAMMQAAVEMGLSEAQGRQLALATFAGAALRRAAFGAARAGHQQGRHHACGAHGDGGGGHEVGVCRGPEGGTGEGEGAGRRVRQVTMSP
jgi:pyrroline-5-carboxylate reductase